MLDSSDLSKARATLNRIARQGRALGVHLIVATQRPDARSLDPQIKANIAGVMCFAMVNEASSISVLGNGRATEIENVKGRAIWKVGSQMETVQTPFLEEFIAKRLLAPYKKKWMKPSDTPVNLNDDPSDRFSPM